MNMNILSSSLFTITLIFNFININGQYADWGCNHFGVYPVGLCLSYSSSYDYKYDCNGTDTITFSRYDAGDCESGDPTYSTGYDLSSSTWSDFAECDASETCGYFMGTCDGIISVGPIVVDVCYSAAGISTEYTCSGSKVTAKVYSSSDCTGSSSSASADYSDLYTNACYEWICEGGSSAASLSIWCAIMVSIISLLSRMV